MMMLREVDVGERVRGFEQKDTERSLTVYKAKDREQKKREEEEKNALEDRKSTMSIMASFLCCPYIETILNLIVTFLFFLLLLICSLNALCVDE
jgi:hypothetical protein